MFMLLMLLSSHIGTEPSLPPRRCPVAERVAAHLGIGRARVPSGCKAEVHLRRAGWSDAWVQGALVNAWHESEWIETAVGDGDHAVGFWQLRDDGLGRGMGDLRYSVGHSTDRVVRSAQRQRIDVSGGDPEEATRQFCIRIMRPSDKLRKGELRARLSAHISDE
jgi:hypothetical protein